MSVINNTFDSRYSVPDIVRSFKSNGIDISHQTASELQSLYKKAVELPTRYFEAKPQRAVSLSEIKAIIMPESGNMSDLESHFDDMGIEIVKYTTEQSRIDALNSLDNVKFQSRRVAKEQDAALENSTSGQTDVDSDVQLQAKPSKKNPEQLDPRTVTREDVEELLNNVNLGAYDDNTYIPLRINTPSALIYWAKKKLNDVIDNNPIAMSAGKAYQAMARRRLGDESRPHKLSVNDMISIIEAMSDPWYIVYQGGNGRYVEVIHYNMEKGKKAFAILEIGEFKDSPYMNGYEDGIYNVLVTTFAPDSGKLNELLNHPKNKVIFDKEKDLSQGTSSSMVPSVLNDKPFYEEIITQENESVKQNSARRRNKNYLDVESRFGVAESVSKYAETVSDPALKAKLKANATTYAKKLDEYETESIRYDNATANGWDEMAAIENRNQIIKNKAAVSCGFCN